ncbi:MAG: type IV pilus twitching motility protein PilT [Tepidanaerobacteraceae bacterium]|jgi:twitching motility protein PilT|nr:type IV pilus twitching motility protein PilT [Tepidanaerobacter sp.]HQA60648.1 type IV pilus twitching motility protein PilT [Tepidanaerobacteraceae bacterium]HQE05596.1 type IV pilus twitching motility protein PilT [Tepidanaerobacteraceae bacterium]
MVKMHGLLEMAVDNNASDLHLTVGVPPVMRIYGKLVFSEMERLTPESTKNLAAEILSQEQLSLLEEEGQVDLSLSLAHIGRFRINVFKQRGSVGLAIRLIPYKIPPFEELNLPPVIRTLAEKESGFILVTGPAGSGKSTTLAAMIDIINSQRSCHIITLEDPIEFLHSHKKSIVNQREIKTDSQSFSAALRAALRQDPDVILVGEMRDLETISIALTAAETGHLVLSTLHTKSAPQSIDRIIDVFPPHQQQQVRIQLANTLVGVVSQRLLPRVDKQGLIPAVEVMISTPAIKNLIREGKTHQIYSSIQTGSKYGMQTMESSIQDLFERGLIGPDQNMSEIQRLGYMPNVLNP